MKKGLIAFSKIAVCLIAIAILTALIRMPQTEGRAAHLDLISIYADPFIIYIYIASIPFFIAVYQTITLLSLVEKNSLYSHAAMKKIRTIKYCAIAFIVFITTAISYIVMRAKIAPNAADDPAGFVGLGILVILAAAATAAATNIFGKHIQKAL